MDQQLLDKVVNILKPASLIQTLVYVAQIVLAIYMHVRKFTVNKLYVRGELLILPTFPSTVFALGILLCAARVEWLNHKQFTFIPIHLLTAVNTGILILIGYCVNAMWITLTSLLRIVLMESSVMIAALCHQNGSYTKDVQLVMNWFQSDDTFKHMQLFVAAIVFYMASHYVRSSHRRCYERIESIRRSVSLAPRSSGQFEVPTSVAKEDASKTKTGYDDRLMKPILPKVKTFQKKCR